MRLAKTEQNVEATFEPLNVSAIFDPVLKNWSKMEKSKGVSALTLFEGNLRDQHLYFSAIFGDIFCF